MNDSPPRKAAPRSEKRQRSRLVVMRCTPAEHIELDAAAAQAGLAVGAYVRQQALGTAGARASRRMAAPRAAMMTAPVDRLELARLLGMMGKWGSNLNQVARALNNRASVPAEVAQAIEDVPEIIATFREAGLAISALLRGRAP